MFLLTIPITKCCERFAIEKKPEPCFLLCLKDRYTIMWNILELIQFLSRPRNNDDDYDEYLVPSSTEYSNIELFGTAMFYV